MEHPFTWWVSLSCQTLESTEKQMKQRAIHYLVALMAVEET